MVRRKLNMQVDFTYWSPMTGTFDYEGPEMTEEDILREIERQYPEATDIELIRLENINAS
jgi:hypothetical protein